MRRAARSLLVVVLAALAGLAGCDGESPREVREARRPRIVARAAPGGPGAGQGAAPVGQFFLKAGVDKLNADLFVASFGPAHYERLSTDRRVTTVGGCPGRVVVAAPQPDVGDTLREFKNGQLVPAGFLSDPAGSNPHLSPDCRLLFSRRHPDAGGGTFNDVNLFDPTTGKVTPVASGPTVAGASWGPGGEILVLRREPAGPRLQLIKPGQSAVELFPAVPDVTNPQWGRTGWIAMAAYAAGGRRPSATLFLNPTTGEQTTFYGWLPLAWSPDGTELLVRDGFKGTTLAVVSVTDLAHARNIGDSEVGPVWDAVWLPADSVSLGPVG